ncbi:MogA/MoaB family molybdenum cofactor biosynthesis protein [Virgibacillus sp. W0430]|uniref:MogA/MoaB family molybdenum cofactor biosynthesis protein n=1 Tax=Virgibacillus sp. W0430 TaxID=3391580 RepID=UPI003F4677FF
MSVQTHKRKQKPINCLVITISDTRTFETDKSGSLLVTLLENAGHCVADRIIIRDNKEEINQIIETSAKNEQIDVILTTGGTGIAYRDVTIEVIQGKLEKEITGFGELFRMLSYTEDIGSAALLSRALAGVYNHTAIIALPGSSGAVKLAMHKLVIPELTHIVNEIKKDI